LVIESLPAPLALKINGDGKPKAERVKEVVAELGQLDVTWGNMSEDNKVPNFQLGWTGGQQI
jgi:hypothetical protein